MNKAQAINSFWNNFEWKAYDVLSIPEDAPTNRITYESVSDDFGNSVSTLVSIWDRSSSWESVTLKEMEIANRIGRGGVLVGFDGGAVWIKKGTPWAQRMDDPNDAYERRIVLSIELEYLD